VGLGDEEEGGDKVLKSCGERRGVGDSVVKVEAAA
jgi:hypothetical protein